jgi:putative ABC transport system permease protein
MSPLALIWKELWHHRANALLVAGGLALAVALLTVVRLTSVAAERETRRVMRDLGFNLRIIPRDTDMEAFWANGYSDQTLPLDTVPRLAAQHGLFVTFNHLTPTLEHRFPVGGRDALLTGLGLSVIGPGEKKQPLGFVIPKGSVYLGSEVAARLGAKPKSKIELAGRSFTVERVLAESGSDDDIRLYTALEDTQALLGLPGRINEIKAIDCLCLTADQDPLSQLRAVLEKALPEAKVLQLRALSDARAKQRQMAERYAAFAVPGVLLGGALWIGLLTVLNVRERRAEIGLWRALGRSSSQLATLFLGKAALLGLLGAGLGYALGTAVALRFGPDIFKVTAKALEPDFALLGWAALLTPVFAAVSAFLPAMLAVAQDPADSLRAD